MERFYIWNPTDSNYQEVQADLFSDQDRWDSNWVNNTCIARWDGGLYLWTVNMANALGDEVQAFVHLSQTIQPPLPGVAHGRS